MVWSSVGEGRRCGLRVLIALSLPSSVVSMCSCGERHLQSPTSSVTEPGARVISVGCNVVPGQVLDRNTHDPSASPGAEPVDDSSFVSLIRGDLFGALIDRLRSSVTLTEHEPEGEVPRGLRCRGPGVPPPRKDVGSALCDSPGGLLEELR